MKYLAIVVAVLISANSFSQAKMIIVGDVKDAGNNEALAYATIGVKGRMDQTVSSSDGKFELSVPVAYSTDTLIVTYVGYHKFEKQISQLASNEHILLKEYPTMLDEVQVVHYQLDLKNVDNSVRVIRDNLYAMNAEVTNTEFNTFLAWLDDFNKSDLRKKYEFNLAGYGKSVRDFYNMYHKPTPDRKRIRGRKDSLVVNYNFCPAVNITYEAAVEYCKWLTDRYNENTKKKKFKKVLFRLPTLNEWQIAALGYDKFQSWELMANNIEVVRQKDSTATITGQSKAERRMVKMNKEIQYPWYFNYYYRNKPYNHMNCYLGNFKVIDGKICPVKPPAFDGFTMMSPVTCYFPNNIGLYDVVGNVAEMVSDKGKACGGSWNDTPENSTIQSVKNYSGPDETVGFRIFMEVIEK